MYSSMQTYMSIYIERDYTIACVIIDPIYSSSYYFFMIGLGAQHGLEAFPAWTHALKDKAQIDAELDSFVN